MLNSIRGITALILFFIPAILFGSEPHYAIVIDAGSTGSRLHLFQYDEVKKIPAITELFSEKITPGLASFASTPEKAGPALAVLLNKANATLATKQINPQDVSLYLFGTAGMRLLAKDSPEKAQTIYAAVSEYISKNYTFHVADINTVPEKMEGVYDWLAVNYLMHHFDANSDETVGIIDMGGASMEIAYSTLDKNRLADEVPIKIGGHVYTVFSQNFLNLGQDQALKAINRRPETADTCYPTNYKREYDRIGNYNFNVCSSLYRDLLAEQHVAEKILPFAKQKFIAFSGIYYTEHFFLETESAPNYQMFSERVRSICQMSWEQLKTSYPQSSENYLAAYCAHGAYVTELLYKTYGLNPTQFNIQNKIEQKDIDWALGALLYQLANVDASFSSSFSRH
jgi:hypothetical protein